MICMVGFPDFFYRDIAIASVTPTIQPSIHKASGEFSFLIQHLGTERLEAPAAR
jgi:hypothetical protein